MSRSVSAASATDADAMGRAPASERRWSAGGREPGYYHPRDRSRGNLRRAYWTGAERRRGPRRRSGRSAERKKEDELFVTLPGQPSAGPRVGFCVALTAFPSQPPAGAPCRRPWARRAPHRDVCGTRKFRRSERKPERCSRCRRRVGLDGARTRGSEASTVDLRQSGDPRH